MMAKVISVVVGVALVGRTAPNSVLQVIGSVEQVIWIQDRGQGGSSPPLPFSHEIENIKQSSHHVQHNYFGGH